MKNKQEKHEDLPMNKGEKMKNKNEQGEHSPTDPGFPKGAPKPLTPEEYAKKQKEARSEDQNMEQIKRGK
jgi:hypothetical protein